MKGRYYKKNYHTKTKGGFIDTKQTFYAANNISSSGNKRQKNLPCVYIYVYVLFSKPSK